MTEFTANTAFFDAVLYPNQPMAKNQARFVLFGFAVIAGLVALAFVAIGAWPVAGFLGLDIVLLVAAFRLIRRSAQRTERVRLDERGLHVEAHEPNGRQRNWRFEPHWVRVHMDNPPTPKSLVTLSSHGSSLRVGAFLTLEDRLTFVQALRQALERFRRAHLS